MNKLTTVVTSLTLAAGCSISHPDGQGGPGFDHGGGGGDDVDVPAEPVLADSYVVESRFVLPQGSLADQAGAAGVFLEMTDDEHDPATWILDEVEDHLGFPYDTALAAARGVLDLDETINDLILDVAPSIVVDLVELGDDLNQVAHAVGLRGRLDVRPDFDGAPVGDLTYSHAVFVVDGARTIIPLADLNMPNVVATQVELIVEDDVLVLGEHTLAVDYGAMVDAAIDRVLVPARDPAATSLSGWAADAVGCEVIGDVVEDIVEIGSNSDYADACDDAVDALIDYLLADLMHSPADLVVTGDADLVDDDDDGVYEAIERGEYSGTALFDTDSTPLDDTSAFSATRR